MTSSNTLRTFIRGLNILSCALLRGALFWFAFFAILLGPCDKQAVRAGDALGQRDRLEKLEIVTSNGTHEFSVEVMRNGLQRERGLMFRRFLDENRGMLFDFETERPVMMWMKNTYLPLDMVFIGRSGKVVGIAENAVPLSEKVISSGVSTFAVLEVNAGTAARIGLRIGDSIHHPIFGH
jgi:uncharacterized membrane protein (UPF0127 family)